MRQSSLNRSTGGSDFPEVRMAELWCPRAAAETDSPPDPEIRLERVAGVFPSAVFSSLRAEDECFATMASETPTAKTAAWVRMVFDVFMGWIGREEYVDHATLLSRERGFLHSVKVV